MNTALTFESEAGLLGETKPSPTWQAAWRFARQIRGKGFLPERHFIDRIAERALGGGVRFDPRTFRTEFYNARHYRQTRPGYTTRIAVVRDVPILYRIGGRRGKHIVLVGALRPDYPLPPSERIAAPQQREDEFLFETETSEEEELRRRLRAGPRRIPPRRRPIRPGRRPNRPIYGRSRLTVVTSDGDGSGGGGGPDDVLRLLIRAKTAMSEAAFAERERGDRKRAERSVRLALDALRKVPATWRSATEGPLEEALNSLARLNNPERFRTFLTRALTRIRDAMEDRRSYLGRG